MIGGYTAQGAAGGWDTWCSLTVVFPTGHYCLGGTSSALPCPEGTLNPREGAPSPRACQPCPAGRYCPGEGNGKTEGKYQQPSRAIVLAPLNGFPQRSPWLGHSLGLSLTAHLSVAFCHFFP